MRYTYLFIGGPASGRRIDVRPSIPPPSVWEVPRIPNSLPYARGNAYAPSAKAIYHVHELTLEGEKRYIYVHESWRAADAFDVLLERFPR